MRIPHRYSIPLVLISMLLLSLACTLGGAAEPTATPTQVSQITIVPPTESPTVPSETVSPSPSATVAEAPTNTPTSTPTPIVGNGPGGCVLRATYIADVTIPDGTVLAPNAPFVKTWRIRNDGTCTWEAGYQLVYADGNQMSGPAAVNIPSASPNQTIDVSVNLAAPGTSGDYTGRWRLRATNNAIFGGFTVVIRVVGTPTPTITPTKTGTPPGGVWSGAWETTYGQMTLVQTGSAVTGVYSNNTGSINGTVAGNRLSGTWAETNGTSGTFDFWIEGSGLRWHGNFNKTTQWCGHRAGQSDLSPCGVSTWYGTWTTNCDSATCGDMTLTQIGDTVSGTYAGGEGSISGTVSGTELSGTWTRSGASGPFKFFMTGNGQQFQGNYNTSFGWCGYRSGSSLPSPCKMP